MPLSSNHATLDFVLTPLVPNMADCRTTSTIQCQILNRTSQILVASFGMNIAHRLELIWCEDDHGQSCKRGESLALTNWGSHSTSQGIIRSLCPSLTLKSPKGLEAEKGVCGKREAGIPAKQLCHWVSTQHYDCTVDWGLYERRRVCAQRPLG